MKLFTFLGLKWTFGWKSFFSVGFFVRRVVEMRPWAVLETVLKVPYPKTHEIPFPVPRSLPFSIPEEPLAINQESKRKKNNKIPPSCTSTLTRTINNQRTIKNPCDILPKWNFLNNAKMQYYFFCKQKKIINCSFYFSDPYLLQFFPNWRAISFIWF